MNVSAVGIDRESSDDVEEIIDVLAMPELKTPKSKKATEKSTFDALPSTQKTTGRNRPRRFPKKLQKKLFVDIDDDVEENKNNVWDVNTSTYSRHKKQR